MSLVPVFSPVGATAYRLDNVAADSVTLDLSAGSSALSHANSFTFRPDGTRLFAGDSFGGDGSVAYWDLSTAWDVSTANYAGAIIFNGQVIDSVKFNANGTKAYIQIGLVLREYNLSTAYGGTATGVQSASLENSGSVGSFEFDADGTQIHYANISAGQLRRRTLSTAYNISTMGAAEITSLSLVDDYFSQGRNGTRLLYIQRAGTDTILEYNGSAYNYAGFSLYETFVTGPMLYAAYAGNGRKLHVLNGTTVTQYSTVG